MPGAPERYRLPAEVRDRLAELRDLSKKAEDGDKEARRKLKQKLRESSPDVIVRASDIGRRAQHLLIETASGGSPLTELALSGRLDMMREEIAGENPSDLESLLIERVVACWMLVQLFEVLMAPQLWEGSPSEKRMSPAFLKHYLQWQDRANRRYLQAIRALAQVRKLQAGGMRGVQVNTQINLHT